MTRRSVSLVVLAVLVAAIGGARPMTLSAGDTNIVQLLQQSSDIVVDRGGSVTEC